MTIDIFAVLGYMVPLAIVNIIICCVILFINIRAKRSEILKTSNGANYLTAKFQRLENIDATRSITVHCIVFLLFYIINVYIIVFIQNSKITSLPLFALVKVSQLSLTLFSCKSKPEAILVNFLVPFLKVVTVTKLHFQEASSLTFPVHGNVHVLLGLMMSSKIREKFSSHKIIKILTCHGSKFRKNTLIPTRRIAPLAETDDYFNAFRKQWA